MSRGLYEDDPYEDEAYDRQLAQERADRAAEKAHAPARLKRGDKVRPTAQVIASTGFTEQSVLTVRLAKITHLCSGCLPAALREERERRAAAGKPELHQGAASRLRREHAHLIRPGELFAASKEHSTALCLRCVEPL